jgi:ABC-type phosphate transport system substrate-binding protein
MAMSQRFRKSFMMGFILCCVTFWSASSSHAANYVVIANKQVTENSLTKGELRSIFLGEKVKWENKKYIKFAVLEDGVAYKDFLQHAVGKTPSQFDQHWMGFVTTGKGSLPKVFSDAHQIIDYVAKQSYAIGFVPAGQETDAVKTISVK